MSTAIRGIIAAVAAVALAVTCLAAVALHEVGAGEKKPNIVFVLTDDMSVDLMRHMDQVQQMQKEGTTFDDYLVGDSLCCTSRASIFTGLYPHNTEVKQNTPPLGGWKRFADPNKDGSTSDSNEKRTFATQLKDDAGYRTGFIGKYMNGYDPAKERVPDGWSEWNAFNGRGYCERDYTMTDYVESRDGEEGRDDPKTVEPEKYATDEMSDRATDFLNRAQEDGDQPFMLEVAPFASHSKTKGCPKGDPKFSAAPRDRIGQAGGDGDCGGGENEKGDCRRLRADHTRAYDEDSSDKPDWVRKEQLTEKEKHRLDRDYRDRARMLQSVDDMIERMRESMSKETAENTYFVFSSDNGFHLGQHRLLEGKSSPYEHDVRVPFVVVGPDVPAGKRVDELAQNVDLFPTFLDMAGMEKQSSDGFSMLPLMQGEQVKDWRRNAFVEHWPVKPKKKGEPDAEGAMSGNSNPPRYKALRTDDAKYVEYTTGERELYDLGSRAYENTNTYDENDPPKDLADRLAAFRGCGPDAKTTCQEAALDD